jgi:eukaryotic-like serine/threonine-protein kinase
MKFVKSVYTFVKNYYISILISMFVLGIIMFSVILYLDTKIMPEYTRAGQEFEIPSVIGMSIDSARTILETDSFFLSDEITKKVDFNKPAGTILDQHPKAGSECKRGRKVYVTVSKGAQPAIVPELIGMSPQDALYKIAEAKLVPDTVLYEFSEQYPDGVVMGQSLVVNDTVDIGDRIFIVVSVGKHPSEYIIPDVKGQVLKNAAETLKRGGFKISEIVYYKNTELLPNTVIDQKPAPGEIVYQGAKIRLLISSLTKSTVAEDSLKD